MAVLNRLVARYNLRLLRTGDYGSPPHWKPWLAQLLAWGCIGLSEKFVTTPVLLIPPIHSSLGRLAAWLERPLLPYPHVELLIVMALAPVLLNVISVVVFDNIMKRRKRDADGAGAAARTGMADDNQGEASRTLTPCAAATSINGSL